MGNIFEDNSLNPFSDPEFRKEFLKDKGLLKDDKSDSGGAADYEVIPPSDITIGKETGKVINPIDVINRSSKIPNSVGTIMHDLSGGKNMGALAKSQKSAEIKSALNTILTEYNQTYGLDIHLDLDNTANMLASLANPTTFRTFELLTVNLFGRFRSLLYFRLIQAMMLLVDDILDPKNLLSSENSIADKWTILSKVGELFNMIEMAKKDIFVEGAETELQKIGSDLQSASSELEGDVRSKEEVKEFMQALLKEKGIGGSK